MSLADGNNFNAKCHLPMIAPFAAAARKKTLSSFQGPDSDQTVLYVLLHPFPLELGISDQFWAPPSARQAFFWQKAKAAWASIPRWPFTGPRHPFTFRWRQGAPAPSALNWALGRGPFQCLPSHYTPLCTGGSSLLVSPLWIPSAHRGEGSCPPCSHHQSSTAQAHGGYSIIRTEQMKNNRMKEERNQAPHREGKEHFCYFPHCSGPGFGRRLPHHTPTSLPPPPHRPRPALGLGTTSPSLLWSSLPRMPIFTLGNPVSPSIPILKIPARVGKIVKCLPKFPSPTIQTLS